MASLIAAALVVLSGCSALSGGSSDNAGSNDKVEKTKVRLGLLPVVDVASVHLAIQEGFFKQEGLDVELIAIQGAGTAIPKLVSSNSEYDVVFGNYLSFFLAESRGVAKDVEGLKFIADGYVAKPNTWMVLTGQNSQVKKVSDLPSHKVAVTTKQSLAEVSIRSVLKVNDVPADKVEFVEMPYTDMGQAMASGRVDAALLAEPYITQAAKKDGAIRLFDAASGPTADLPIAGYGTTGKFARENPKTVAAFQRAFTKGQELAGQNRSKVEELLPGYAKIDKQTAALVNLGGFPTRLEAARLQRIPDLMKEFNILNDRIDANTMILGGAAK